MDDSLPLRVAVVGDDPLERAALVAALASDARLAVVGAWSPSAAVPQLDGEAEGTFDVLVWDAPPPLPGGGAGALLVLVDEESADATTALPGAAGRIGRSAGAARLLAAVIAVGHGLVVSDPTLGPALGPGFGLGFDPGVGPLGGGSWPDADADAGGAPRAGAGARPEAAGAARPTGDGSTGASSGASSGAASGVPIGAEVPGSPESSRGRGRDPERATPPTPTPADLTPRELDVLALLLRGASNKQAARALDISEHTVKFHVASLLSKFGASSRTELVVRALQSGAVRL